MNAQLEAALDSIEEQLIARHPSLADVVRNNPIELAAMAAILDSIVTIRSLLSSI